MTAADWKDSLLLRSYAYSSSFSTAMANSDEYSDENADMGDVSAQLEALGLDADIVEIDLQDMPQAKREAALRSLGVVLPRHH